MTKLATNTNRNVKTNEAQNEVPNVTNLATTAPVNAYINEVKNKISNITNLATAPTAVKNKISDHGKFITSP